MFDFPRKCFQMSEMTGSRANSAWFCPFPHNLLQKMEDLNVRIVLFLFGISGLLSGREVLGFDVYWNVPSQQCIKHGVNFPSLLKQYGIVVNEDDQFKGDKITIFYESELGNYPKIDVDDKDINGGIPLLADLDAHLNKTSEDIQRIIPSQQWNGIGVIDWEAWRPVWEFNWGGMRKYQERALKVAQDLYPDRNKSQINQLAEELWENSTKSWMLETLGLCREKRPKGRWGFYLSPDCYNYVGNSPEEFYCSKDIQKGNDKLKWLWEASTALFPSVYVYESHIERYTFDERTWYTNGRLGEAKRVASPGARIYPYINYSQQTGTMVPEVEFKRVLSQVAASGVDGAVIWGSSASVGSQTLCKQLWDYVTEVLGPSVEHISARADCCSDTICNGRGRCTWPQDSKVQAWKSMQDRLDSSFYAGNITCRCPENFQNKYCNSFINTQFHEKCVNGKCM